MTLPGMNALDVRPVRVAMDKGAEDGLLVLSDEVLVAVLGCLDDPIYQHERHHWYLEAGFGACATRHGTFPTLEGALRWVAERLGLEAEAAIAPALDLARSGRLHC